MLLHRFIPHWVLNLNYAFKLLINNGYLSPYFRWWNKEAATISVISRKKVLRLIMNEILFDRKIIMIKHSMPLTCSSAPSELSSRGPEVSSYLLLSDCNQLASGQPVYEAFSEVLARPQSGLKRLRRKLFFTRMASLY